MPCYWAGEIALGHLQGVISTKACWLNTSEVVLVNFDSSKIPLELFVVSGYESLHNSTSTVYTFSDEQKKRVEKVLPKANVNSTSSFTLLREAKNSDQKYYLDNTVYRYLPLTPMQASYVNSMIAEQKNFTNILSPRQIKIANFLQDNKGSSTLKHIDRVPFSLEHLPDYIIKFEDAITIKN